MAPENTAEIPPGVQVVKPGFGYVGTLVRYETKYRTRWAVVQWNGRPFTAREYPTSIERTDRP